MCAMHGPRAQILSLFCGKKMKMEKKERKEEVTYAPNTPRPLQPAGYVGWIIWVKFFLQVENINPPH